MKLLVSVSVLRLSGNLFHKIGAADAKARSPYVQVDEVGTIRNATSIECFKSNLKRVFFYSPN